jgi:hypothetical protein
MCGDIHVFEKKAADCLHMYRCLKRAEEGCWSRRSEGFEEIIEGKTEDEEARECDCRQIFFLTCVK